MSNKNHKMVNGRLLQTNKRFSALKISQKEKINSWLYDEYRALYLKNNRPPDAKNNDFVLNNVQEKIDNAQIWLPFHELQKYYYSRKNKFRKRFEKESIKTDVLLNDKTSNGEL